jgi:serine/threonine protein kinase
MYSSLKATVPTLGDSGFDLLQRLLTYNPSRRLTAAEALAHPFFTTPPLPKAVHLMPTFPVINLTPVRLVNDLRKILIWLLEFSIIYLFIYLFACFQGH